MKRMLCLLVSICCLLSLAGLSCSAEATAQISAVDVALPEITVTVSKATALPSLVSATLDGEELSLLSAEKYNTTSFQTGIYILLDISKSVSAGDFEAILQTLSAYVGSLPGTCSVKLFVFDENTTQLLSGNESRDEAVELIANIKRDGNYTTLYDSLYLVHERARAEMGKYDRQFAFVFTDGDNQDNDSKRTFDETKAILSDRAMPLYAMCLRNAEARDRDLLAELARASGGENQLFSKADIDEAFASHTDDINSALIIKLRKADNKGSDTYKSLSVSLDGRVLQPVTVFESALTALPTPSVELQVEAQNKGRTLLVSFSTAVIGADSLEAYALTDESSNPIAIESVAVLSETEYELSLAQSLSGRASLSVSGLVRAEDRALISRVSASINAGSEGIPTALLILLCAIALVAVIGIVLIVIFVSRKKTVNNLKEVFTVESENNYEVRHHIVNANNGRDLTLSVATKNVRNVIKTRINSSAIVGRSEACDICIDDVIMSRQHFVIENIGSSLYVSDLNSKNGTCVNGKLIDGRTELRSGDTLSAGHTTMLITF